MEDFFTHAEAAELVEGYTSFRKRFVLEEVENGEDLVDEWCSADFLNNIVRALSDVIGGEDFSQIEARGLLLYASLGCHFESSSPAQQLKNSREINSVLWQECNALPVFIQDLSRTAAEYKLCTRRIQLTTNPAPSLLLASASALKALRQSLGLLFLLMIGCRSQLEFLRELSEAQVNKTMPLIVFLFELLPSGSHDGHTDRDVQVFPYRKLLLIIRWHVVLFVCEGSRAESLLQSGDKSDSEEEPVDHVVPIVYPQDTHNKPALSATSNANLLKLNLGAVTIDSGTLNPHVQVQRLLSRRNLPDTPVASPRVRAQTPVFSQVKSRQSDLEGLCLAATDRFKTPTIVCDSDTRSWLKSQPQDDEGVSLPKYIAFGQLPKALEEGLDIIAHAMHTSQRGTTTSIARDADSCSSWGERYFLWLSQSMGRYTEALVRIILALNQRTPSRNILGIDFVTEIVFDEENVEPAEFRHHMQIIMESVTFILLTLCKAFGRVQHLQQAVLIKHLRDKNAALVLLKLLNQAYLTVSKRDQRILNVLASYTVLTLSQSYQPSTLDSSLQSFKETYRARIGKARGNVGTAPNDSAVRVGAENRLCVGYGSALRLIQKLVKDSPIHGFFLVKLNAHAVLKIFWNKVKNHSQLIPDEDDPSERLTGQLESLEERVSYTKKDKWAGLKSGKSKRATKLANSGTFGKGEFSASGSGGSLTDLTQPPIDYGGRVSKLPLSPKVGQDQVNRGPSTRLDHLGEDVDGPRARRSTFGDRSYPKQAILSGDSTVQAAGFYCLKVLKTLMRFLPEVWRVENMEIITQIFLQVRMELVDTWLIPFDPALTPIPPDGPPPGALLDTTSFTNAASTTEGKRLGQGLTLEQKLQQHMQILRNKYDACEQYTKKAFKADN